jgi:hypothetical protein
VAATRAATETELLTLALARAAKFVAEGVTTIEIKSGWLADRCGLSAPRAEAWDNGTGNGTDVPRRARRAAELQRPRRRCVVVATMLPAVRRRVADAVDAFCEHRVLTGQTARVFERAAALGAVKLHADQLSDLGGAALAARFRRCPPITSSTRARRVCARWPRRARLTSCCRALSTSSAKHGCRRSSFSGAMASRSRWRPTAIRVPRR